jgi:hypothetical protein
MPNIRTERNGRFTFRVVYHPATCIATLAAGKDSTRAVVKGCGQAGPRGPAGPPGERGAAVPAIGENAGSASAFLVQEDHLVRSDRKVRRASRATRVHKALKGCRGRRAKPGSVGRQGRLALQDRPVR